MALTLADVDSGLFTMNELASPRYARQVEKVMNSGALCLTSPQALGRADGSYYISPHTDDGHVLVRSGDEVCAFLNVCPHRLKMLFVRDSKLDEVTGGRRGTVKNIVCAAHNWSWKRDGRHRKSPSFRFRDEPCLDLSRVPLENIGGLYWSGNTEDLQGVEEILSLPILEENHITSFIPEDWDLHKVEVHDEKGFRPETGMVVFVDVDHVDDPAIHGGTYKQLVHIIGLKMSYAKNGCIQYLPWLEEPNLSEIKQEFLAYRGAVLELNNGIPSFGAIWIAHYGDNTTLEIFPFARVVSRFAPGNLTRNSLEYYYPRDVVERMPDFPKIFEELYALPVVEDRVLAEEIEKGHQIMQKYGPGQMVTGPIHPQQEGGISHYFKWLRQRIEYQF
jgi:nitrite reductase/ring-hydroxylating ferredoxin subunit